MNSKKLLFIPSILALMLSIPLVVQAQPPGGGGNVQAQLDDLDQRVSTLEGQTLDTRIGTLEGQNLDGRIDTLEGQNLDSRVSALEALA